MQWGSSGKASVLVGGQFGSEGKGSIAAYLAQFHDFDICTTNAGAQAGHTTRWCNMITMPRHLPPTMVLRHLPTAGVVQPGAMIYLNGGSILDPEFLEKEIKDWLGDNTARLHIHPLAAIIQPDDVAHETGMGDMTNRIGSTSKGVGSALSRKIMRQAPLAHTCPVTSRFTATIDLNQRLVNGQSIMVEVPQGTGLSINHGYVYPYTTSRDCHIGQGLSDAGIHPSFVGDICMVVRAYPIRVGGNSGPFYPGSSELDWENHFPGVEPEKTTVTQRVRRIATWSSVQYKAALSLNRPTHVALTFCDYFSNENAFAQRVRNMRETEEALGLAPIHIYAWGPYVETITDRPEEAYEMVAKSKKAHIVFQETK